MLVEFARLTFTYYALAELARLTNMHYVLAELARHSSTYTMCVAERARLRSTRASS